MTEELSREALIREMLQDFRARLEQYVPREVLEMEMQELEEKYER